MFKKLLILFITVFTTVSIESQNITYDLRCSLDKSFYELYVTRDATATAPVNTAASSRITLVLPTDGGTRTVGITNESVSTYSALPAIINPNSTNNDYFGFSTSGGSSLIGVLVANVPTLWMTFTPSDGTSQNVRLFINGSDPAPGDSGMGGVDLSHNFTTISTAGTVDEYNSNISGNINCGTLDIDKYLLSTINIYPNPAKNKIYLNGDLSKLKTVDIYSIAGQHVMNIENNFEEIDIFHLNSSIYFIKLNSIFITCCPAKE